MKNNYDRFYLDAYKPTEPKESFKFIGAHFKSFAHGHKGLDIADIGCGTGDFLYYLRTVVGDTHTYCGYDIDQTLLDKAKGIGFGEFALCDISDSATLPARKFDFVFMNGVTSYFDSVEMWAGNLASLLKSSGTAFVYGTFNAEDVDVLIKLRDVGAGHDFFTWGNIFSLRTVRSVFESIGCRLRHFPFQISIDVSKSADPIRSWTFMDEFGTRITKNGAQIIQNYHLLEIAKIGDGPDAAPSTTG